MPLTIGESDADRDYVTLDQNNPPTLGSSGGGIYIYSGYIWADEKTKIFVPNLPIYVTEESINVYYDGSAWQYEKTEVNNLDYDEQYNNISSGMATMTNSYYKAYLIYLHTNLTVYIVHSQSQYETVDEMRDDLRERSNMIFPDEIQQNAVFVGFYWIQKGAGFTASDRLYDSSEIDGDLYVTTGALSSTLSSIEQTVGLNDASGTGTTTLQHLHAGAAKFSVSTTDTTSGHFSYTLADLVGTKDVLFYDTADQILTTIPEIELKSPANNDVMLRFTDGTTRAEFEWDYSLDRLNIGTATTTLQINEGTRDFDMNGELYVDNLITVDGASTSKIRLTAGTSSTASIELGDTSDVDIGKIVYDNSTNTLSLTASATELLTMTSSTTTFKPQTPDGGIRVDTTATNGNNFIYIDSKTNYDCGLSFREDNTDIFKIYADVSETPERLIFTRKPASSAMTMSYEGNGNLSIGSFSSNWPSWSLVNGSSGNTWTMRNRGDNDKIELFFNAGSPAFSVSSTSGTVNFLNNVTPAFDGGGDLGDSDSLSWDVLYARSTSIVASDSRLKENIIDTPLGLSFIDKLRPVAYTIKNYERKIVDKHPEPINDEEGKVIGFTDTIYRYEQTNYQRKHYGLIAQEVKTAIEECGETMSDTAIICHNQLSEPNELGMTDKYALRYGELTAPMIAAIKELSAKNTLLESRIAALEAYHP